MVIKQLYLRPSLADPLLRCPLNHAISSMQVLWGCRLSGIFSWWCLPSFSVEAIKSLLQVVWRLNWLPWMQLFWGESYLILVMDWFWSLQYWSIWVVTISFTCYNLSVSDWIGTRQLLPTHPKTLFFSPCQTHLPSSETFPCSLPTTLYHVQTGSPPINLLYFSFSGFYQALPLWLSFLSYNHPCTQPPNTKTITQLSPHMYRGTHILIEGLNSLQHKISNSINP